MSKEPRTLASEDLAESRGNSAVLPQARKLGLHPLSPKLQPAKRPTDQLKGRSSPPLPGTEHTHGPARCLWTPAWPPGPPIAYGPESGPLTSRGSGVERAPRRGAVAVG